MAGPNDASGTDDTSEHNEDSADPAGLLLAALQADPEAESNELGEAIEIEGASNIDWERSSSGQLLSLEAASEKLPPEFLTILAEKFKGSVTQVRKVDGRDQLF